MQTNAPDAAGAAIAAPTPPIYRATSADGTQVDVKPLEHSPDVLIQVGEDLVSIPADCLGPLARNLSIAQLMMQRRYPV